MAATLAFELIPQDPMRSEYRQGSTLGEDCKHWFRAKFFQQYRVFFRYHQARRIIVYAWVNAQKVDEIRKSTNGDFALGSERFKKEIEVALGRRARRGNLEGRGASKVPRTRSGIRRESKERAEE